MKKKEFLLLNEYVIFNMISFLGNAYQKISDQHSLSNNGHSPLLITLCLKDQIHYFEFHAMRQSFGK